ncbi:MAG: PEP-CTERM sorting domain-containing protein, partial [Gemmataceae bacterium]
GGREYFVAIDPILANLPMPGVPTPALINARVLVSQNEGQPIDPPFQVPEPGTLLLGAAALGGLAGRRWLRLV